MVEEVTVQNKELVPDPTVELNDSELPRRTWRRLNRFRSGHDVVRTYYTSGNLRIHLC